MLYRGRPELVGVRCAAQRTEWQIPLGQRGEGHFGLSTVTLIIINAKTHTLKHHILNKSRHEDQTNVQLVSEQ